MRANIHERNLGCVTFLSIRQFDCTSMVSSSGYAHVGHAVKPTTHVTMAMQRIQVRLSEASDDDENSNHSTSNRRCFADKTKSRVKRKSTRRCRVLREADDICFLVVSVTSQRVVPGLTRQVSRRW